MSQARIPGTLLPIGLFVLLPLYEIADYSEHWPNDGSYVSIVLSVLFFVGLTLAARRMASNTSEQAAAFQTSQQSVKSTLWGSVSPETPREVGSDPSAALSIWRNHLKRARVLVPSSSTDSPSTPRFLVIRDFRI